MIAFEVILPLLRREPHRALRFEQQILHKRVLFDAVVGRMGNHLIVKIEPSSWRIVVGFRYGFDKGRPVGVILEFGDRNVLELVNYGPFFLPL